MSNIVNEKFLRVIGKIGVDEDLNLGDEVLLRATIVSHSIKDNDDGTVDLTHTAKIYLLDS